MGWHLAHRKYELRRTLLQTIAVLKTCFFCILRIKLRYFILIRNIFFFNVKMLMMMPFFVSFIFDTWVFTQNIWSQSAWKSESKYPDGTSHLWLGVWWTADTRTFYPGTDWANHRAGVGWSGQSEGRTRSRRGVTFLYRNILFILNSRRLSYGTRGAARDQGSANT